MKGCIFCKIIKREIPATVVEEDESLLAIEDANPQSPVHVLIMPKKHYSTLLDCNDDEDREMIGKMACMASRIARNKGCHERGFRIAINVNKGGGQTVFHLHMHLLAGRPLSGRLG